MGEGPSHSAYIIIHGPGYDGLRVALREGITSFGRLTSNDVEMKGDLVSRHHSRITFFEGRATAQDLGSHNGTWVNGERITTRVLKDGDMCRIGNYRLSFHEGESSAPIRPTSIDEATAAEKNGPATGSIPRGPTRNGGESGPVLPKPYGSSPSESVIMQAIERARSGQGQDARAMQLLMRATEAMARAEDARGFVLQMLTLALEQTAGAMAVHLVRQDDSSAASVAAAVGPDGQIDSPHVAMSVVKWSVSKNFPLISADVGNDLRFPDDGPSRVEGPLAVLCVPLVIRTRVSGAIYVARSSPPFSDDDLDALSAVAYITGLGLTHAGQRHDGALRERLALFHGAEISGALLERARGVVEAAPATSKATVLVADAPGLASVLDRMSPGEAAALLDDYLEELAEIVRSRGGVLVPSVDGRMWALFGAPNSPGHEPARAAAAALEMRSTLERLCTRHPQGSGLRLRAGLATGRVRAGPVGGMRRLAFLSVGEPMAMASRLEQAAPPGRILADEDTHAGLKELFEMRPVPTQGPRGRPDAPGVFEIVGLSSDGR